MYSYPYLTGLGLVLVLSNTHGQTEREHDSHAHGAAQLDVVIDGDTVLLEFNSPWVNLVGFEHSPSTDEQHEAIDTAMSTLDSAETLFELDADCRAQTSDVRSSMEEHDEHDEHAENEEHDEHDEHAENEEHDEHDEHAENEEHDEHDEHAENEEHAEHHDDEKHDGHDDHDSDEHESAHSEVSASYAFTCEDVSELESIDVLLIRQWPGIEQLAVQLAGPNGQSAVTLSADQQRIDLDAIL